MDKFIPENIRESILKKDFPSIVMWNRLEGRPRAHDFDRALKAEVRDALWMITKQWQMGELKGDDAGTPVFAKVHIASSYLNQYQTKGKTQVYEPAIPLEVKVEQKKIPFVSNKKVVSIDIRLQMGRYWQKLLQKNALPYFEAYKTKYPFVLPEHNRSNDQLYANREEWQRHAAISGRTIDGYSLYERLKAGVFASDGITTAEPDKSKIDAIGQTFKKWYEKTFYQPEESNSEAWMPESLEYQFGCDAVSKEGTKALKAKEYYHGHLDWYAFDIAESSQKGDDELIKFTDTFIPSQVAFEGMPNTRWWKFEDGKTNLGDIKPSTTDLSKLLLMEFGLVYANDWFLFPFKLPIGSMANVKGLVVSNNFGETIWIDPSEKGSSVGLPWSMYKLHAAQQDNTLFLAPAASKVQEGLPIEEILLVKDEMSNMVWGIETKVPNSFGYGEKGNEIAQGIHQYHMGVVAKGNGIEKESLFHLGHLNSLPSLSADLGIAKTKLTKIIGDLAQYDVDVFLLEKELGHVREILQAEDALKEYKESKEELGYKANISYLAMTEVPENWIPFVPVHVKGESRETQLQRGSMLRIIENDTFDPVKIKPMTSILREGLDAIPKPLPYKIHEEEVPRAGVKVSQAFQRTRWCNGEVFVWLGMQKKTGKGEGSSGLAFDQIKDVKTK